MPTIKIPFFIRFDDLEKRIKEILGEDYIIVDLFQDEDGWQVAIEKIYSSNENVYLREPPEMIWFNPVIIDRQRN
jgi:hypothetical protein